MRSWFKRLFMIFWFLTAVGGTALAGFLAKSRGDWVVLTTDPSPWAYAVAQYIAIGCGSILALYGIVAIIRPRKWFVGGLALLLSPAYFAALYVPTVYSLSAGLGALSLGVVTLWVIERKDKKSKAPAKADAPPKGGKSS